MKQISLKADYCQIVGEEEKGMCSTGCGCSFGRWFWMVFGRFLKD